MGTRSSKEAAELAAGVRAINQYRRSRKLADELLKRAYTPANTWGITDSEWILITRAAGLDHSTSVERVIASEMLIGDNPEVARLKEGLQQIVEMARRSDAHPDIDIGAFARDVLHGET